jgi:hypothetical protein
VNRGPFENADQARDLPEVREIYRTYTPGSLLADGAQRLITQALYAAGVSLGAYDEALTRFIGGFEPQIAAVVASWVARASTAENLAPTGGSYPTVGNAIPRPSGVLIVSARLEAIRGVLAGFDPETGDAAAVLDLVDQIANTSRTESGVEAGGSASLLRADVATILDALSTAAEYLGDRIATCPDCPHTEGGLCTTCDHRLKRADSFEVLAGLLRGAR